MNQGERLYVCPEPYRNKCRLKCSRRKPHKHEIIYDLMILHDLCPACIPVEKKEEKCEHNWIESDEGTVLICSKCKLVMNRGTSKAVGPEGVDIDKILCDWKCGIEGYRSRCKAFVCKKEKKELIIQLESFHRKEICGEIEKELRKVFSDNYLFSYSRIYRHSMLQENIKDIISETLQKLKQSKR